MMTSILIKERTKKEYLEKISNEPIGTQKNKQFAITNFEKFVSYKYDDMTIDDLIRELSILLGIEKDVALYDMLQDWINWNAKNGKKSSYIRSMFSFLRNYLYFRGVKTNPQE